MAVLCQCHHDGLTGAAVVLFPAKCYWARGGEWGDQGREGGGRGGLGLCRGGVEMAAASTAES